MDMRKRGGIFKMTTLKEYKEMMEGATDAPLPCLCGNKPFWGLTQLTGCQLHGEPIQHLKLMCKNKDCPAKPEIIGGDKFRYGDSGEWLKKGNDEARALTIKIWNDWITKNDKLTPELIRAIELAEEALLEIEHSDECAQIVATRALSEIRKLKGE